MPKITKRFVDSVKKPHGMDIVYWDDEIKGFGLRVKPNGKGSYIVNYRNKSGIARRLTLGCANVLTAEQARLQARKAMGQVIQGEDLVEGRMSARRELTVAQLCDRYLEKGCATKKASTVKVDIGRIERHIKPLLGKQKIGTLRRSHIEQFLQDVANGKTSLNEKGTKLHGRIRVTGGKGTATRTVGLLGGIFTFAINEGLLESNPVRGVKRYKDKRHERFLSPKELADLGHIIGSIRENYRNLADKNHKKISPYALAALQLLILTGCRKSEIITLQWPHVDFVNSCLRLPDSKTGAKIVPLGAAAIQILSQLPKVQNNPYVIVGEKEGGYFVGLPGVWKRISRLAGLQNVRLHDLRHSFASAAAASGNSLLMIGALLGHKDPSTTKRYAHLADDPLKAAADQISSKIAGMMNGDVGRLHSMRG